MADAHTSSPGWYADPSGIHQFRYYGTTWTDHVSDRGVVTTSPLTQPTYGTTAAAQPAPPATWPTASYSAPTTSGVARTGSIRRVATTGPVLVLVGGVLMALGTLLAWETVSASSGYSTIAADVKGTSEGAGPVVLVAGLIAALLAVLVLTGTTARRKSGIATLLISAVSLVFVLGNYSSISKDVNSAPTGVTANIGIGLIFAVIGCVMAAIASIGLIWKKR